MASPRPAIGTVPSSTPEPPLRVAFADIATPDWGAGVTYNFNLLSALRQLDESRRPQVTLVFWPHNRTKAHEAYQHLADAVIEVPPGRTGTWIERQVTRVARRVGIESHAMHPVEEVLRGHRIDAMFACWMELGPTFHL